MSLRLRFVFSVLFVITFCGNVFAQTPKVLLIKDLEPGTEAVGFSVFRGFEPEPFQVLLGNIVDNFGNSLILAKISGGPLETKLENIGAVSGMSGSPIYVNCDNPVDPDNCAKTGTLVGALSYGPGSFIVGGPNVLITPAEYMLGARLGGYVATKNFSNRMPSKISVGGMDFFDLMLFPKLDTLTSQSVLPGKCKISSVGEIKPGSMVTVLLARGGISFGASGTVTWRDGNKIYIFGHPFLGTGIVEYPFVHIAVADVIQTPVNAHKMAGCRLDTEGAIKVDGAFELAGVIGEVAPMLSLRVEFHLDKEGTFLEEEVALSPMRRRIISDIPEMWSKQVLGDLSSVSISYQVRVSIRDEPEIFLRNVIPVGFGGNSKNERSPFEELFLKVDSILERIDKSKPNYVVESIKIHVDFISNLKIWRENISFLSQENAIPGETVYANVVLREVSSGSIRKMSIPVKVPDDFMERTESGSASKITLLFQSGNNFIDQRESREKVSPKGFVEQINETDRPSNILYVQQIMPRSKKEQKTDDISAKTSVGTAWKWTELEENELLQFPREIKKEVFLRLSPVLDNFVDVDSSLSLTVEEKDSGVSDKKNKRKKKWFFLFLH